MDQTKVAHYFALLMSEGFGLDMSNPNLCGTPERVAKMFCQEFFRNISEEFPEERLTLFPNDDGYDEIILSDNIPFISVCSHHFLPFTGKAWFAYIPKDKLVGASKLTRIVQHYAARPQLQETLAKQVVDRFEHIVKPSGTLLVMRAIHNCMACRGVKTGSKAGLVTSIVTGVFKENLSTRNEAMQLISMSNTL